MTNLFYSDGLIVALILLLCTATYLRRIPRINSFLSERRKGENLKLERESSLEFMDDGVRGNGRVSLNKRGGILAKGSLKEAALQHPSRKRKEIEKSLV